MINFAVEKVFEVQKRVALWVFLGFENFFRKSPCMKGPRSISFSSLADPSLGDASRSEQTRGEELGSTERQKWRNEVEKSLKNGLTVADNSGYHVEPSKTRNRP